jgi:DNA-binding HxlR family transcriptional regulator
MSDCSQKMLSQTLKRLEQIGLISRQVYPEVPPRVEYSLTARGQSLMPHVSALIGWALENFDIAQNKPILFKTECFKS